MKVSFAVERESQAWHIRFAFGGITAVIPVGRSVDQRICVVCLVAKQGLRVDAFSKDPHKSRS